MLRGAEGVFDNWIHTRGAHQRPREFTEGEVEMTDIWASDDYPTFQGLLDKITCGGTAETVMRKVKGARKETATLTSFKTCLEIIVWRFR
jgi:hypothetical protein